MAPKRVPFSSDRAGRRSAAAEAIMMARVGRTESHAERKRDVDVRREEPADDDPDGL